MPGFTTIFLGLSAAFGGLITIFTWYLFKSLSHIYKTFNLKEIRLIFYGFTSFLFSSLSLLVINLASIILDLTQILEEGMLITLNEFSYILYNLYLIIGLGLLIISNWRGKRIETLSEEIYAITLIPAIITLLFILKIMSVILVIELITFIIITFKKQHQLFSSNLWTISLLLIMIGRIINLAFPGEFAYMAVIYFDLFAFTSLVLMMLEARERVLGSEIQT